MLGRDGLGSYYAASNLNPGYYLQLAAINDRVGALLLRGDTAYLACEGNVYVWTGSSLQKVASVHWPASSGHGVVPLDPRPTLAT